MIIGSYWPPLGCRATTITISSRVVGGRALISTFRDVTKYTIGGIISNLCHGSRDRGSYKDFIVNEALQEEINL